MKKGGGESSLGAKVHDGNDDYGCGRGWGRGHGHSSNKGGWSGNASHQEGDGGRGSLGGHNKSKVKCFNCDIYDHYASECCKPHCNWEEANLTRTQEDEPTLLMVIYTEEMPGMALLNEGNEHPALSTGNGMRVSRVIP